MGSSRAQGLKALADLFGDRFRRHTGPGGSQEDAGASVLPARVEEVRRLAEVAHDHSLGLVAAGGGTGPSVEREVDVLVRFDLMRGVRLPAAGGDDPWADAEPGALWLQMDNELRMRGRGLAVYPTSAPRATVGGWLATDGLGVGSFEYGRLRENVLSASVVLPGGELCEVEGERLGDFVGSRSGAGIVVGAKLRTRRADTDMPFAAAIADAEDALGAVEELAGSAVPLWHLAFLNPAMATVRGLGEDHLLFGAYPNGRSEEVEASLGRAVEARGGRRLGAADAHKAWGERFYPVAPSRPAPEVVREFVPLEGLRKELDARPGAAVQCTVSRSGETLLLALGAGEGAPRAAP
jgi:FAD/FMN-containing dehydrogenase